MGHIDLMRPMGAMGQWGAMGHWGAMGAMGPKGCEARDNMMNPAPDSAAGFTP
jgi:hypothetical protein